ncbi:MAG: chorismate-binding protein, partial [Dehalococcoidia bacterium]
MATRLEKLAGGLGRPALITSPLPEQLADRLASQGMESLRRRSTVSWEVPERNLALFGFGIAAECTGPRESPLSEAVDRLREAGAGARSGDVPAIVRPRWFGGGRFVPGGTAHDIAWDPFGGWRFLIPRVLLAVREQAAFASLTLLTDPGGRVSEAVEAAIEEGLSGALPAGVALPSVDGFREWGRRDWENSVRLALREMEGDTLEKVVLARSLRLATEIDEGQLLSNLAERYRQCFVFSFKGAGGTWLGASPEL